MELIEVVVDGSAHLTRSSALPSTTHRDFEQQRLTILQGAGRATEQAEYRYTDGSVHTPKTPHMRMAGLGHYWPGRRIEQNGGMEHDQKYMNLEQK